MTTLQSATSVPATGMTLIEVPWYAALSTDRHTTYVLRDAKDRVLYVGVTRNLRKRARQHSRRFLDMATIALYEHPTRLEAEEHESTLIALLRPLYNVAVGTGRFGS